jgi:hypothetical protein
MFVFLEEMNQGFGYLFFTELFIVIPVEGNQTFKHSLPDLDGKFEV